MATKKSKYQGISLLAQLGSAYTYPGSPSNRMLQYGLQNAQAGIQEEILKKQQEKKKSGIGGILGTLGGAALAIPTGGMSIAAGAALGGSLGGAVDSAISGDYAGAGNELVDAANYWDTREKKEDSLPNMDTNGKLALKYPYMPQTVEQVPAPANVQQNTGQKLILKQKIYGYDPSNPYGAWQEY